MGNIEYTIGFFAKVAPGSEDGSPDVPQMVLDNPEFARVKQKSMSDIETAVTFIPPSKKWFSGILTIQVSNLQLLQSFIGLAELPRFRFMKSES